MPQNRLQFKAKVVPLTGKVLVTFFGIISIIWGPKAVASFFMWFLKELQFQDGTTADSKTDAHDIRWLVWGLGLINLLNLAVILWSESLVAVGRITEPSAVIDWRLRASIFVALFSGQIWLTLLFRLLAGVHSSSGALVIEEVSEISKAGWNFGWFLLTMAAGYLTSLFQLGVNSKLGLAIMVGSWFFIAAVFEDSFFRWLLSKVWSSRRLIYRHSIPWFASRLTTFIVASLPIVTLPWTLRWFLKEIAGRVELANSSDGFTRALGGSLQSLTHVSVGETEVKMFSRPGGSITPAASLISHPNVKDVPQISWRKFSLLGAPIIIGLVNLVDAHFDKKKAFITGRESYLRLVGEGEQAQRVEPEEGHSVGKKRRAGIIAEATEHAAGTIQGSKNRSQLIEDQGSAADPVLRQQAEATLELMTPQHELGKNLAHITRLALLKYEGIEISIQPFLSDTKFKGVNQRRVADEGEVNRRIRSTGRLLSFAAIAKDRGNPTSSIYRRCQ